jgi:caspase domain-containing protein
LSGSPQASPRSRAITAERPSIAGALTDVDVLWIPPGERPPPDAWRFCVRWLDPRPRSAAVQYLENARPFEPRAPRAGKPAVALFRAPAFDEIVALAMWLWERSRRARPTGKPWEAVAYYADNVRQGLLPEKVDPTVAPQSVYSAISEERISRDPAGFLEHAVWLVELLVEKLEAGRSLFDEDLVSDEPFLEEYLAMLRPDEGHYRDDVNRRSQRYLASIPDPSVGVAATELPLLAVRHPKATRFRMWAQRDPGAPEGEGWPLLVIQKSPIPGTPGAPGGSHFQITATVAAKVTLEFLAAPLTELERAVVGPGADKWYAGEDYGGRMVASPEKGTRLSFEQVLQVLSGPLSLKPVQKRWTPLKRRAFAAFAVASWVLFFALLSPGGRNAILSVFRPRQPPPPTQPTPPAPDDRGVKTPGRGGVAPREAFLARKDRALLVATEKYQDRAWRDLKVPVSQARLLRDALVRRDFDVILLENPTLAQFQDALARTTKQVWGPYDQFVLYFAGHGSVSGLRRGRLVLANSSGADANYLSLADLRVWLRDHPSHHVLVLLDSCYSGDISLDPPTDLQGTAAPTTYRGALGVDESVAREKIASRVRRYLTAVGRDVTPDDSRFTPAIIEMLHAGAGQEEYVTDLGLAARLEGVQPSPKYGRLEGDVQAGAVVFRPPR